MRVLHMIDSFAKDVTDLLKCFLGSFRALHAVERSLGPRECIRNRREFRACARKQSLLRSDVGSCRFDDGEALLDARRKLRQTIDGRLKTSQHALEMSGNPCFPHLLASRSLEFSSFAPYALSLLSKPLKSFLPLFTEV